MEYNNTTIWTEKYRPHEFEEVVGQDEIIKRVKNLVNSMNIPHLLFAGPAGTGKSTLALIVVKKLYGKNWKENYLELNASDERGIDVVRQKVKDFARTKSLGDVPFKVIFLDEADALTKEAQQALRRTMENYTGTCRFVMSCVTPDTKILLPEEVEISIDEFMKNFENKRLTKIQNFKESQSKEDLVLATIKLDPKIIGRKTFEITTMTGRRLKVTEDHRLLTDTGWKSAGKITKEDKLLIYPHLEGTHFEDNENKIIDINRFIEFLTEREEKEGYKDIINSYRYKDLKTIEKNKVINRIKELNNLIKTNKGLTKREKEVYDIIKNNEQTSRIQIQQLIKLSRIRTDQLLKSIESKEYITRYIGKRKMHYFIVNDEEPIILRNLIDIRNVIEKDFNIKISYSGIKKALSSEIMHGNVDKVIGELKRKKLLDLTYNSKQIGALSRIVAFMMGDGHIVKNDIRLHFSGNKKALENVKKDLIILGYENFSKISEKRLTNEIRGREFAGISTSFYLDSRTLSLFLQFLGVPKGDKVAVPYKLPEFIKNGTNFVKREFLRSIFGCEADKPSCRKSNFYAINLRLNKIKSLKNNMVEFFSELRELLGNFKVDSYITVRDLKEIRKKDLYKTLTFVLTINYSNENLYRFFSKIGYAYEEYKSRLSRLSSEYLKHKLYIIELWKEKSQLIKVEINKGKSYRSVAKIAECTSDFVANQLKEKEVRLPWKNFYTFNEWINKYENNCFIESEILDISEIKCTDVRDITCFEDHNFVANGFISHNCNYSSKILDPIQSRCVILRFKLLEKKDIEKRVKLIAEKEKLSLSDEAIETLYEVSDGDCRRVINLLQASASISPTITVELINTMTSAAKPKDIKVVLEYALSGDFLKAKEKLLDVMLKESVSGTDIIKSIQKEIWNLDVDPELKVRLTEKTGEAEFRMVEGSDEFIQLEALLAGFVLAGRGK